MWPVKDRKIPNTKLAGVFTQHDGKLKMSATKECHFKFLKSLHRLFSAPRSGKAFFLPRKKKSEKQTYNT